ncbi:MAG: GNAT family N-acetyltransferase [Chloroflexota bacterium]
MTAAPIRVVQVVDRVQLESWIRFPRESVYPAATPWVPPLDRDVRRLLDPRVNPFFRRGTAQAYLALDAGGAVVGRIAAQVYHGHNVRHGERTAFFGLLESKNEAHVTRALLDAAAEFGARRGCGLLRGPFNLTAMQEVGVLLSGFSEPPALEQTYTAPFYPQLLELSGLQPVHPMTTFRVDDVATVDPLDLLEDRHRLLLATGRVRIRRIRMRHFDSELEVLRDLANDAFLEDPLYVPLTQEEMRFQFEHLRPLIDPELCLVAEVDGEPVGFVSAVPDANPVLKRLNGRGGARLRLELMGFRRSRRDAALLLMGVARQLQGQGLIRVLHSRLIEALRRGGYGGLSTTWVADANARSAASLLALGARPVHHLTLYQAAISPEGRVQT